MTTTLKRLLTSALVAAVAVAASATPALAKMSLNHNETVVCDR